MTARPTLAGPASIGSGAALLAYCLGFLALGWPWLSGAVTIPWDAKAHWYPHLVFTARALHAGESPFWTPAIFAGSPEIADPQSILFSPLMLLALVDPTPSLVAMDRLVFAVIFCGGLALIGLGRLWGWSPAAAAYAALTFAFGAALAWRIQHVNQAMAASLFLIVWLFLERSITRRSFAAAVAAGGVAGLLLASRDQIALLSAYVLVARAIVLVARLDRSFAAIGPAVARLAVMGVVALAIAVPPALLAFAWGLQSTRIAIDMDGAGRGALHVAHLLSLFIGNLYGAAGELKNHWGPPSPIWGETGLFLARNMGVLYVGAGAILLVVALARSGAMLEREPRFAATTLAILTLFALGTATPAFELFWRSPGVSLYRRPADAVFLIGVFLAVLSGHAAHRWLEGRLRIGAPEAGVAAAALGLGLWLIVAKGAPAPASTALTVAAVSLAVLLAILRFAPRFGAKSAFLALFLVTIVDLRVTNGPSESTALPPETYRVLTPTGVDPTLEAVTSRLVVAGARRDRVEFVNLGYHWQNVALARGLEDVLGFNPVRSGAYSRLVGAGDIALVGARTFPPSFADYASPLARILGISLVVAGAEFQQLQGLDLVAVAREARVFRAPGLARARVVGQVGRFDPETATTGWPAGFDPERTVLLDRAETGPDRPPGDAEILRYSNDLVVIRASAPQGGWLVLADAWHPWWEARVNGVPTPVERAYGIVRAVEIPPGTSEVRFVFAPVSGLWRDIRRGFR